MKKFINQTDAGNEKAIRRGVRVPDGDVNLAWAKAPALNPRDNIVIIDTSQVTPENVDSGVTTAKLMYADEIGVLQDVFGNQVIFEEYPAVADVFTIDEDFSTVEGNEYTNNSILPFVHVSRYFHIDFKGYASHDTVKKLTLSNVKVIDNTGKEYVDDNGKPLYRIAVARAVEVEPVTAETGNVTVSPQTAYRLHVYVDTDQNENLFLHYNKVELAVDGTFKNQNINHREILNPAPYFKYIPEETDVFDPANRNKKQFSTKPTNQKEQILGIKTSQADGYKVYVPKKALPDPRIFQLFRWRVNCNFVEKIKIDPTSSKQVVRCGTVSTNWVNPYYEAGTRALWPYVFYNMEVSEYNAAKLQFVNPISEKNRAADVTLDMDNSKQSATYWNVNFDTIGQVDLQEFDILFWHVETDEFDFTPYLNKIDYFTRQLGGTLIIECGGSRHPQGLGIGFTNSIDPVNGEVYLSGDAPGNFVFMDTLRPVDTTDIFWDGDVQLGGWDFNDGSNDEYNSLHPALVKQIPAWTDGRGKMDFISYNPPSYEAILVADDITGSPKSKMLRREFESGGAVIIDTADVATNVLYNRTNGYLVSQNAGDTIYPASDSDYIGMTSSFVQEGTYKLFYNMCLYAVKGRTLDDSDEFTLTSTFSFNSDWHPSWVINNQDDVLSRKEVDANQFVERPKSLEDVAVVWQRRLEVPSGKGTTVSKTVKQLIEETMSAEDLRKVANSTRTYSIQVTNSNVEHVSSDLLQENEPPYVWTDAFTPKFIIPPDFGPNIVREKLIPGEYVAGQYVARTYPPKPYGARVDVKYSNTSQDLDTEVINWTAQGTATETITVIDKRRETYTTSGNPGTWMSEQPFDYGVRHPIGIDTYADANYYATHSNHNYHSYAAFFRLHYGDIGKVVYWMQIALNYFIHYGYMQGPTVPVDGYWGNATHNAVLRFQSQFIGLEQDGQLDAEMLSLMGSQILRLQQDYFGEHGTYIQDWEYPAGIPDNAIANPNTTFFLSPLFQMSRIGISDDGPIFTYSKRSNYGGPNTPGYIWDILQVSIDRQTTISGITIVPHVESHGTLGGNIIIEAVDVVNRHGVPSIDFSDPQKPYGVPVYNPFNGSIMGNYPVGSMRPVGIRATHGQETYIPIGPIYGDTVVVKIAQDTPSGRGKVLQMGVANIYLHTDQSFTTQGTINISAGGQASVTTGKDVVITVTPQYQGQGILSNIHWTGVTIVDSEVINATITPSGILTLRNFLVDNNYSSNYTAGPYIGRPRLDGTMLPPGGGGETYQHEGEMWYSKDENGRLNPLPETGWINKVDGIKLFCTKEGRPFGFPDMPTDIGPNEAQRHYATLGLSLLDTDEEVLMGFYDIHHQEFILNAEGKPEMTYLEWINRGPNNVFIAAVTDAEVEKKVNLPTDGGPPLPYRIAMPVYGICTRPGSHIGVDYLPEQLGPFDTWTLPIRTGHFTRSYALPEVFDKPLTNEWLRKYAGTTVKAFYSVPEAEEGGWSVIYGRPFVDVRDESPIVLSDTKIKVRQPPIHMVQEPTVYNIAGESADPIRPVMKIWTRTTTNGSWTQLSADAIADYNVSTGEIQLVEPLASADSSYVKVDYTSARSVYNMRQANGEDLNLNPYLPETKSLIGKAIYVYVLPEFVKDEDNKMIPESVEDATLRWTLDPSVFDLLSPNYNPLAIELAVVFITTTLDINDLSILDTRHRGGGAKDAATLAEISRMVNEASSYWDVSYSGGLTYQKGGFIIIRLPEAIKEQFPNDDVIIETVRRNITAGVQFKIEYVDLEVQ